MDPLKKDDPQFLTTYEPNMYYPPDGGEPVENMDTSATDRASITTEEFKELRKAESEEQLANKKVYLEHQAKGKTNNGQEETRETSSMVDTNPTETAAPAPVPAPSSTIPQKRPAEDEPEKPMSKNALKRLRKQQQWEAGKEDRKQKRKDSRVARKVRKREERDALIAQGIDPYADKKQKPPSVNVPISLIFDCDFEQYMRDKELISLGSQITRSYSENKNAKFRTHIYVSNWKGKLAERFHQILEDKHHNWKGIDFVEGDFIECAKKAREKMKDKNDHMIEPLQRSLAEKSPWVRDEKDPLPLPDPEPEPRPEYNDIVYLSSDSPYTLERLEPNTSYIIGGLVDKNREKGLCYKRARERGIRTARLPIGQYMVMQSRTVLTTNHVIEIMLKWLEYENWGDAFLSVIPKRKGGQLRQQEGASAEAEDAEGAEIEELEENDEIKDPDAEESCPEQSTPEVEVTLK
jgi:tRNA (guanine9-N1)-methyltransferase